jgi:hypothetical protein
MPRHAGQHRRRDPATAKPERGRSGPPAVRDSATGLGQQPHRHRHHGGECHQRYLSGGGTGGQFLRQCLYQGTTDRGGQQLSESGHGHPGQIDGLKAQIAAAFKPGSAPPGANPQTTSLSTQVGLLQQQEDSLRTEATVGAGGVQLLRPAGAPRSPASPNPIRNGLLGLVGGLVLGIALAFVRERLTTPSPVRTTWTWPSPASRPGLIPAIANWRDETKTDLVTATRPQSATAEAYRSLRTSVQFLSLDRRLRTLLVTSPKSAEGKTTTLANLAVALAGAGQRVAVVCCDLRRPRIHHFFGLSNQVGLTTVLAGQIPLSEALQQVPDQEGLVLLASGPSPPTLPSYCPAHVW